MPAWHVGTRDAGCAYEFMTDLAPRLKSRVQLTTDGHRAYLEAVDLAFGGAVDCAMLVELYGAEPAGEARYSPAKCVGTRRDPISGNPDPDHVSTSYVERQNLSMRMGNRRFTRLTNAFSRKVENRVRALSIYFMHYNFVRIHQTLRCTPAMEAKVTDRLWSLDDMAALVEAREASASDVTRKGWAKRGATGVSPSRYGHLRGGQGCARCVVRRNDYGIGCAANVPAAGGGLHALVVNGLREGHEY